jgi:hypothetical protein
MPEDGPFGETFFEARLRAIVAASFLKSPSCGYVDSVFTPADHFRLPFELRCAAPRAVVVVLPVLFVDVRLVDALFVAARFVPVRLVLAFIGISPSSSLRCKRISGLTEPRGLPEFVFLFPLVIVHLIAIPSGNAQQFATVLRRYCRLYRRGWRLSSRTASRPENTSLKHRHNR